LFSRWEWAGTAGRQGGRGSRERVATWKPGRGGWVAKAPALRGLPYLPRLAWVTRYRRDA